MTNPHITIITASAGTGKTHRLTEEYLAAMKDDQSFRRILAVTFTNKATAEMKDRIVASLAADPCRKTQLCALLHGWSAFGVSTIDAFLQKTLRDLSPAQGGTRRLILDEGDIADKVADAVLAAAGGDAALRAILADAALSRLQEGRSWSLRPVIDETLHTFLDEPRLLSQAFGDEGPVTTEDIDTAARDLAATISSFKNALVAAGEVGVAAMAAARRSPESFKGKSRSPMTAFARWAQGEIKEPPAKLQSCKEETDDDGIIAAIDRISALFKEPYMEYRTATAIQDTIPLLRLYGAVATALKQVLAEEDATLLKEDSAKLAQRLVQQGAINMRAGGTTLPDTIFIDEAQDTSRLQWEALKPFVAETTADGTTLIVGDIKQSIYRWRNSDWHLLGGDMLKSLAPARARHLVISENWRSGEAIVTLVNRIFGGAPQWLQDKSMTEEAALANRIYKDAMETIPQARAKAAADGQATLRLLPGEGWRDAALDMLVADIDTLRKQGFPLSAITILVRRNSDAALVAQHLTDHGVPSSSDDAWRAGGNGAVRRALALLRQTAFPLDAIAAHERQALCPQQTLQERGSLAETVAAAIRLAAPCGGDMPFTDALADQAAEWQRNHGSQLAPFLLWWDDHGEGVSAAVTATGDAVRVMTIHKAKGLSLDAVLIPFAAEAFSAPPMLAPTIWCHAKGRYSSLGLLPMKAAESKLKGTAFEEALREEKLEQSIDTLNTMYVAMTRARRRMYVYLPTGGKGKTTFQNMVCDILADDIKDDSVVTGTALPYTDSTTPAATMTLDTLPSGDALSRVHLRLAPKG